MKNGLLVSTVFFLFVVSCSSVTGTDQFARMREIADDSNLTEPQKTTIRHNATQLAFQSVYAEDSTFIDLPDDEIDFYYDLLVTIVNSDAGKEYIPIVANLNMFPQYSPFSLSVSALNSAPFYENWTDSTIETGIDEIDELLVNRGFYIQRIYDWSFNENLVFSLASTQAYNTIQISRLLESTNFFEYAHTSYTCCDGSNIIVEETDRYYGMNALKVTYLYKYGDCPSGCTNMDYYIFKIYESGKVEFVEKQLSNY